MKNSLPDAICPLENKIIIVVITLILINLDYLKDYSQKSMTYTKLGCDLTKVKNPEKWVAGLGLPLV